MKFLFLLFLLSHNPLPSYLFSPPLILLVLSLFQPLSLIFQPVTQTLSFLLLASLLPPPFTPSYLSPSIPLLFATNHRSPLPFYTPPLFPVARALRPLCSPPTLRRRAPAPAPETGASSAKEAAKQLSLMKRVEFHPTWTSLSFTASGEVITVMARAPKEVWDPSEGDKAVYWLPFGRRLTVPYGRQETHGLRRDKNVNK